MKDGLHNNPNDFITNLTERILSDVEVKILKYGLKNGNVTQPTNLKLWSLLRISGIYRDISIFTTMYNVTWLLNFLYILFSFIYINRWSALKPKKYKISFQYLNMALRVKKEWKAFFIASNTSWYCSYLCNHNCSKGHYRRHCLI